jgi:hypothetical protein
VPKPFEHPVYVTRPFLPPLEDFKRGLQEIWENAWPTNLQRYEKALGHHFACYRCVPPSGPLTTARQVAQRILTLPIYDSLSLDDVSRICDIIASVCRATSRPSQAHVQRLADLETV